jgi:hypothetical protein
MFSFQTESTFRFYLTVLLQTVIEDIHVIKHQSENLLLASITSKIWCNSISFDSDP